MRINYKILAENVEKFEAMDTIIKGLPKACQEQIDKVQEMAGGTIQIYMKNISIDNGGNKTYNMPDLTHSVVYKSDYIAVHTGANLVFIIPSKGISDDIPLVIDIITTRT